MAAPIRYLSALEVDAAMPPVEDRLALAERTMTALATDAELPPKIGVHPRAEGSFAHAMPAYLRGAADDGVGDLLGIKWVAGFPANRDRGLAAIHAVVVLNDPLTGEPSAILDGGPITAQRTAAVSGVVIRRFGPGPGVLGGRAARVAIVGAGVQGHAHVPVIAHVLPGAELTLHDRNGDRAAALADVASSTPGIGAVAVAGTARDAVGAADVVVTAVTFAAPEARQVMTGEWLRPDALIVPVDYATMCAADVARGASLFVVDDRAQFLANRDAGQFDGYPDPGATIGEAILAGAGRPARGRVVATHLGVGLADVIFGEAIVRRAEGSGLGTLLGG